MTADAQTPAAAQTADGRVSKLSLRGVGKGYLQASGSRIEAIRDIALDISAGEFVCIIGPSGCGKSTLLNLIAGLEKPDSGKILMDGRVIQGPAPERTMLFQEPALFPWMSIAENVEYPLRLKGMEADMRKVWAAEWLVKVQLGKFADAQPHELSPGMRHRAALARGLACQPEVLLADEPFGTLDAQTREILQIELQRVWSDAGNTVVFVTHNVREAVFLADRVLLMSTRPGYFAAEHLISAPRPRDFDDVLLNKVVSDIHEHLLREVRKVVETEVVGKPGPA